MYTENGKRRSCRERSWIRSFVGRVKCCRHPFLPLTLSSFTSSFSLISHFFSPSSFCLHSPLLRQLSFSSPWVQKTDKLFHKWLSFPRSTCLLKMDEEKRRKTLMQRKEWWVTIKFWIKREIMERGRRVRREKVVNFWHI